MCDLASPWQTTSKCKLLIRLCNAILATHNGCRTLLEWHREKAGSIEAIHDIPKNELAAGVVAVRSFWSQCGVVTDVDPDAQRADGPEADGAAGRIRDGTAEEVTVSDLQYGGANRAACPKDRLSHQRCRLAAVAGTNAATAELKARFCDKAETSF
jgi:hypothetical protein